MHNPLTDFVSLPAGTIYPTPEQMAPGVERLFSKRSLLRLLVRVRDVVLDDAGNARSARIEHVDGFADGAAWVEWEVGRRLCMNGFRIELRDTKRAGLHIRIGKVVEDSPVDENGYRIMEPTFVSSWKIAKEGLVVLTPCDPIEPGYLLPFGTLPEDQEERVLLRNVLTTRFCADDTTAELMLHGLGPEYRGSVANRYAVRRH